MAVTFATLDDIFKETKRFLRKVQIAQTRLETTKAGYQGRPSKENAAVKRSSMDLTRSLADLRK